MLRITRAMPLFLVPLIALASGCAGSAVQTRSVPADFTPKPQPQASANRFQDDPLEGRTAVESAIELSEKYARLSDQTVALREENQRITAENEDLLQRITVLETKLRQSQKELGEANDLLIEMLTELNNWKTNILGFRGEMREAAKAQLEALLKVLEILGGESDASELQRRHAGTLNPGSRNAQQANEPTTSVAGEPNVP
jgi:DNA anti-recombination protein RmuC